MNDQRLLIHAGTLITADANNTVRHEQGVLVENGTIAAVDDWALLASAEGAHIIDAGKAWWISTFPGLAILTTVMAFNLLGDGLRSALDPRMRVD